jgi:hypothetical protein
MLKRRSPSPKIGQGGHGEEAVDAKKELRTADELSAMIAERFNLPRINVSVAKDPAYGWHRTVYATPSNAHGLQIQAEEIAQELRE